MAFKLFLAGMMLWAGIGHALALHVAPWRTTQPRPEGPAYHRPPSVPPRFGADNPADMAERFLRLERNGAGHVLAVPMRGPSQPTGHKSVRGSARLSSRSQSARSSAGRPESVVDRILRAPGHRDKRRREQRLSALKVKAKALYCVDYSSNTVLLAKNVDEPLPIASITKLLTAMTVLDSMELDRVVKVGSFVKSVEPKKVGIRPGDLLTVRDLLHGMLIESGNDCAEVLANAYQGGRSAFIKAMNRKAQALGANSTRVFTPSGLDSPLVLGKKNGSLVVTKKFNQATAADVALIARNALQYPLISKISGKKSHRMTTRNTRKRTYRLRSNDRLLHRPLPVAVAKTGYTSLAGRCIVALFKDAKTEHVVVVLNSPHHFKAAERIYRWARTLN